MTPEEERRKLLSFVVVGGGPTGVEVAAELYDMIHEDLSVGGGVGRDRRAAGGGTGLGSQDASFVGWVLTGGVQGATYRQETAGALYDLLPAVPMFASCACTQDKPGCSPPPATR
jgi:hypothetical protein